MKNKWLIILGVFLLVIGISLTAYSVTRSDFKKSKYKEEDIVFEEITKSYEEINHINLEVNADVVSFVCEEREDIYIQNKTLNDQTYNIVVENDTLSIVQSDISWWDTFWNLDFFTQSVYSKKPLIIKVPNNKIFNYTITLNAGTINISNIESKSIKVELNAGELTKENVVADEIKTEVNAGKANLKNIVAKSFESQINAGELIYKGKILERGKVEVSAGSAKLNFTDSKENYTIDGQGNGNCIITTEKALGSITYSFNND